MLISSRGRYALLVMIDLAEHRTGGFIPVKETAARLELSQKYLERIMLTLARAGLIEGAHGKGGGYRLTREPSDYSIGEIIRAADGSGVAGVWQQLDARIAGYLDSVLLSSLTSGDAADEYVI